MMQKFIFFFMMMLPTVVSAQMLDMATPIMEEVYYVGLAEKLDNEIELSFNQAGMNMQEARLSVAYLKAKANMLEVKEKTLNCLREEGLNFTVENDHDKISKCFAFYREQLMAQNLKAKDNPNLAEEMIVAGYFVSDKQDIKGNQQQKTLALMTNLASGIAMSRMNVQSLYQETLECLSDFSGTSADRLKKLSVCTGASQQKFGQEMDIAMQELMPYARFFAQLVMRPDMQ